MWSRAGEDTRTGRLAWAIAFALSGIGLLLFNFGFFTAYEPFIQYTLAGLLVLGALVAFGNYLSQRSHWWRLIPGWTLLALASMIALVTVETVDRRLVAALLFWGQALAFGHIYLLNRQDRWWVIIPGGFMLVLGGVIALSSRTQNTDILGAVLFTGLGVVFLLLYLLGSHTQHWWALIPGMVLIVFGLFLLSVEDQASPLWRWWPILLVLLGGGLGWMAFRPRKTEKLSMHSAPDLSRRSATKHKGKASPPSAVRGQLGEYKGPAPGASVEVLSDPDEE